MQRTEHREAIPLAVNATLALEGTVVGTASHRQLFVLLPFVATVIAALSE
jgi:hypothetical protein